VTVVAFDLSLTGTGWADAIGYGVLTPPTSANRGTDRLRWIRDAVLARAAGAAVVSLEGYSFASRGRAIVSLGELGGVIRCAFADAGIVTVDVAPTTRAMYATGKGNAGKPEVLAAAIRALGYTGHSFDEADALWLRSMALEHYQPSGARLTEKQRKALTSVDWPALAAGHV
jgi:Holliday junction resolvasome RuvABC endonuclease subunit